jgi:hypothetical protein
MGRNKAARGQRKERKASAKWMGDGWWQGGTPLESTMLHTPSVSSLRRNSMHSIVTLNRVFVDFGPF